MIKEDLNIYEVLIDSIRETTSASNEPICDKYKFDFDKQSGQKLFSALRKRFRSFLLTKIALGKHAILAISTLSSSKVYSSLIKRSQKKLSMSEGEHRGDKLSTGEIPNKLVKNSKSPMLLLGLIKLGSEF